MAGKILDWYFSFDGRLARLPYFLRNVCIGIAAGVIFFISIPLFVYGKFLWWIGLFVVSVSLAVLAVGSASLIARRLHDVGFSGYHAIWIVPIQLVPGVSPPDLSHNSNLYSLLFLTIGFWLLFWPGNKTTNRYGEAPE